VARKRMFNGGFRALKDLVAESSPTASRVVDGVSKIGKMGNKTGKGLGDGLKKAYRTGRQGAESVLLGGAKVAGNIYRAPGKALIGGAKVAGNIRRGARPFAEKALIGGAKVAGNIYRAPGNALIGGAKVAGNIHRGVKALPGKFKRAAGRAYDKMADATDFEKKLMTRRARVYDEASAMNEKIDKERAAIRDRYFQEREKARANQPLLLNAPNEPLLLNAPPKTTQQRHENAKGSTKDRLVQDETTAFRSGLIRDSDMSVDTKKHIDNLRNSAHAEALEANAKIDALKHMDVMDAAELDGGRKGVKETAGALKDNFKNHFFGENGEENLKAAGVQVAKSAAVSAAAHGGLAALEGEDAWEAAKKGAFRGALGAGLYQGAKGATGANAGSIWGNIKQIGRTTQDMYNATTVAGREALRKGNMSGSLATLMQARRGALLSKPQKHTLKGNQ